MFYRNKKGLTLIELIIVMAVMVILASISFVSVQYIIESNSSKEMLAKCKDAVDVCETSAEFLNTPASYDHPDDHNYDIDMYDDVTVTKFREMVKDNTNSGYEIWIRTYYTSPYRSYFSGADSDKDLVIVYITGLNNPLDRGLNLEVKGAWFIKKGDSTPSLTYDATTKEHENDRSSLPL